ncbi:MAG: class I SAM-dependent methyltransferase [Acidimicrobiales bacterium]
MLEAEYEDKVGLYALASSPEVVAAVTASLPTGGRLLDIGCGTGNLLRQFRATASFLAGIDVAEGACAVARGVADQVVNAPIDSDDFPFPDHSFDVVVCADVLEHLADPAVGLAKAIRWCRPDGTIVISVPNIAYWRARLRLLRGVWQYEETGVFDNGHLRFFTYSSLRDFLSWHGVDVVDYRPALREFWRGVRGFRRLPAAIQAPVERAWDHLGRRRPSLLALQHICSCRPPQEPMASANRNRPLPPGRW